RTYALEQSFPEFLCLAALISLQSQIECNFDCALRVKPKTNGLGLVERAHHQSARHQKDQGQGDLRNDETALKPRSAVATKGYFFFQRRDQISLSCLQRRQQSEKQARSEREQKRKDVDAIVDMNLKRQRYVQGKLESRHETCEPECG